MISSSQATSSMIMLHNDHEHTELILDLTGYPLNPDLVFYQRCNASDSQSGDLFSAESAASRATVIGFFCVDLRCWCGSREAMHCTFSSCKRDRVNIRLQARQNIRWLVTRPFQDRYVVIVALLRARGDTRRSFRRRTAFHGKSAVILEIL